MKIYLVGGAVRDKLLGLPIKERDYVVVGATVADMLKRGYQQVGKDFPVFLHPKTREEYALARKERKTAPGYTGFDVDTSPHISLTDDLLRRDLTINAMAESEEGELIDPYYGKDDLEKKLLRHISPAFSEDPVRILRVGRFLARYAHLGFVIAPETLQLMRTMVDSGEVDALVAERVWKELERALSEKNPEKFFEALRDCHALQKLFPTINENDFSRLITTSSLTDNTLIRFAAILSHSTEKSIKTICDRYRVPIAHKELALLTARYHRTIMEIDPKSANEWLTLFHGLDIFRRDARFQQFLTVCEAIAKTEKITFNKDWVINCANAARSYDVHELIRQGLTDKALADALKEKRRERIEEWLKVCYDRRR